MTPPQLGGIRVTFSGTPGTRECNRALAPPRNWLLSSGNENLILNCRVQEGIRQLGSLPNSRCNGSIFVSK
jgi:hypothetical protein